MEDKYYWPHWTKTNADRSLTIKTTGYDQDQTHWIDCITVAPTEADYEFWLWLSKNRRDLLTGPDVALLKLDFQSRSSKQRAVLVLKNS